MTSLPWDMYLAYYLYNEAQCNGITPYGNVPCIFFGFRCIANPGQACEN